MDVVCGNIFSPSPTLIHIKRHVLLPATKENGHSPLHLPIPMPRPPKKRKKENGHNASRNRDKIKRLLIWAPKIRSASLLSFPFDNKLHNLVLLGFPSLAKVILNSSFLDKKLCCMLGKTNIKGLTFGVMCSLKWLFIKINCRYLCPWVRDKGNNVDASQELEKALSQSGASVEDVGFYLSWNDVKY